MAGRRNPFREIEEMMNRMSRQLEESMGGSELSELTGGSGTAVDVAERDDAFVVTADLPGFDKEDIDVTLQGERLRIDAEREQSGEEGGGEDGRFIRKERSRRSVSRSVTVPGDVDAENVSAEFQNGVLTVTLPKREAADDSRRIDIS